MLSIVILGNLGLYGFFMRKRGLWFAIRVIPLHLFYLLYSGVAFAAGALLYRVRHLAAGEGNK
mgnify:CR=1 FL=1